MGWLLPEQTDNEESSLAFSDYDLAEKNIIFAALYWLFKSWRIVKSKIRHIDHTSQWGSVKEFTKTFTIPSWFWENCEERGKILSNTYRGQKWRTFALNSGIVLLNILLWGHSLDSINMVCVCTQCQIALFKIISTVHISFGE